MKVIPENKVIYHIVIVLLISYYPVGIIHEYGHILVCVANHLPYRLDLSIISQSGNCYDSPEPLLLFWVLGGIFGMLLALSPFIAWNWVKSHKGVMIGLLSVASAQGFNAIIESAFHNWYIAEPSSRIIVFFIFELVVIVFYFVIFAKRK